MKTALATFIVLILVAVAVFGLYFNIGHAMHDESCTYAVGEMALCAMSLERLSDWQKILGAIFAQILALLSISFLAVYGYRAGPDPNRLIFLTSALRRVIRPTLMQELFSDGILNRKEAYCS